MISTKDLIEFIDAKVLSYTDKPLTLIQQEILRQALNSQKLCEITIPGYASSTIQRSLWYTLRDTLSECLGKTVTFNTLCLELEQAYKESESEESEESEKDNLADAVSLVEDSHPESAQPFQTVLQNLPARSCAVFCGREAELARLLELLSPKYGANIITVDGTGGIGKTTLVLEAAYCCLHASNSTYNLQGQSRRLAAPSFDAIIFITAKEQQLISSNIIRIKSPHRTLAAIFHQIARVIHDLELAGIAIEWQKELIEDALRQRQTLLIIDNLETIIDQEEVLSFLCNLPPTVKVVVTSRRRMIINAYVNLAPMSKQEGLSLIDYEAQAKRVQLTVGDRLKLYQMTGGVPIAINYALGQFASGHSVTEVLQQLHEPTGDVARFCFEHSMQSLRGHPAHRVLMAMTLFLAPARPDALIQVAVPDIEVGSPTARNTLAQLRDLSMVSLTDSRYSMLPLTREYALAELKNHPQFVNTAQPRWANWYIDFAATYGQLHVDEWSGYGFDELTAEWQNLQAVMAWCITGNHYAEALQLWCNLESYTQFRGRNVGRSGYWGDRLIWTKDLMQMAERRGDWQTLTQVSLNRVWTLTAIGKPELLLEAEQLLKQHWQRRDQYDLQTQAELVESLLVLYLSQDRIDEAKDWLDKAQTLLAPNDLPQMVSSSDTITKTPGKRLPLNDLSLKHHRIQARLPAYQGILLSKEGDHEQAREQYQIALEIAHQLDWKRQIAIIGCRLAENTAELTDDPQQLEAARRNVEAGLDMAEKNYDRTHGAFCRLALARLAKAMGNLPEAKHLAQEALTNFEALSMKRYAKEANELLLWLEQGS